MSNRFVCVKISYKNFLWNIQDVRHQVLDNAAAVASAYQVGKLESSACANLLKNISPETVERLKELVRLVDDENIGNSVSSA